MKWRGATGPLPPVPEDAEDAVGDPLAVVVLASVGKRLARALPFLASEGAIVRALAEVREAVDLADRAEPLPTADLPEVDAALDRARIGSTLANEELRAIVSCLGAAKTLRRFL